MVLQVSNLQKGDILHNISFSIPKGQMVAIMGPSGSGKSTLLYNIAGMDTPDGGSVKLQQQEIVSLSEDEKAGLRLKEFGFVFQQMNMLSNLTILDNIIYPSMQYRKRSEKAKVVRKAKELMRAMSIDELANRRINEVSGGQLQRACICRSLMNDPKIVFADEPTGALNKQAAKEVMEEFQKIHENGTTILMVTHDSKIASQCERILYIIDGCIQGEFQSDMELSDREREGKVKEWLTQMGW